MKSKPSSHCGTIVWAAVTTEGKSPARVCRGSGNHKPVAYSVKMMSGGKTWACPQTPPKSERTLAAGEAVPCALQMKLLSMPFPPFPTAWHFVFSFPRVSCCSYQSSQNPVPKVRYSPFQTLCLPAVQCDLSFMFRESTNL